ncbi:MAG: alpha-amylase family glycosyl hydrolase [Planctomycetota bacterium]
MGAIPLAQGLKAEQCLSIQHFTRSIREPGSGRSSRRAGTKITLADVPDDEFEKIARLEVDYLWMLGVWQTGPAGRMASRTRPEWRAEYLRTLPDLTEDDIVGSPFAIQSYTVHADFGGPAALAAFRRKLAERGMKLFLDFVPNHMALDHPWVISKPEFFVRGCPGDVEKDAQNFVRLNTCQGPTILAHGRDPYFPGWPDTVQLDYRSRRLRTAMADELFKISQICDGVRCDMAMLIIPEVFNRTWQSAMTSSEGTREMSEPFWPGAIERVKRSRPDFLFMAEAYWDLEFTLQQQGFDYTYDKRFYDRLTLQSAGEVRGHLWADANYQHRSVRFLENHDEPRAAAVFSKSVHPAAATIAFLVPGLRFFHDGQLEGRTVKLPVHLGRRPHEPIDSELADFYQLLFRVLKRPEARDGQWRLLRCEPAWEGNSTFEHFLAFSWDLGDSRLLVTVNFGPTQGQCYVDLAFGNLAGRQWRLADLTGDARYDRDGTELMTRGLFLDMPAWGHHVFEVTAL